MTIALHAYRPRYLTYQLRTERDGPDRDHDVSRRSRDRDRGRGREDGDQARRSHGGASNGRHGGSHMERERGRSSRNGSEGYYPGGSSNGRVSNTTLIRLGYTRNVPLPAAEEEARIRLLEERIGVLERLRIVSLTNDRQRAPNDHVPYNESAYGDVADIYNANLTPNTLNSESTISMKKKFPFHRWDAFCAAKGETFRNPEKKNEDGVMADLTECCICLEGFNEGDKLIRLCCRHTFHHGCLELWVRNSSDCPLCRADITVML